MRLLNKLRQESADLKKESDGMFGAAGEEDRELTDEERGRDDEIETRLGELKDSIARAERAAAREVAIAEMETPAPIEENRTAVPAGTGARDVTEIAKFRTFGEQLLAVRNAGIGMQTDPRLLDVARAAPTGLGEQVGADGGFLVQQDFAVDLLKRTYEIGQVSSRVRRIPIGPNSNGIKINAMNETSRVDGSRWGGIQMYWQDEADAMSGSRPAFRVMELSLKKLTGLAYATDELLEDATALGAVITDGFSEEFNFKVENAIVRGSGAGQPLGILNGNAIVTVAAETGQLAATVNNDNIVKMYARCWARSRQNAVWLINQDIEPQLFTMGITVGVGGSPVYLPPGGLSAAPYGTLLGLPVIAVEYCSTLGTVGDIILVDLSQYLMVDKGALASASSIHVRFVNNETTFRFTYRVDGQPIWNNVLTPFQGTNTLAPTVVLATRS